ncbi:hypothetical protein F4818DRAFT_436898 [Hypoxylon cercidicola]|nr:hypothetical protein F4818DRAFT_436898 [Hypoxylon cercidicola]
MGRGKDFSCGFPSLGKKKKKVTSRLRAVGNYMSINCGLPTRKRERMVLSDGDEVSLTRLSPVNGNDEEEPNSPAHENEAIVSKETFQLTRAPIQPHHGEDRVPTDITNNHLEAVPAGNHQPLNRDTGYNAETARRIVEAALLGSERRGSIANANSEAPRSGVSHARPLGPPNGSGLSSSASMMDLNKPLPKYPRNDVTSAYVDRQRMECDEALAKWTSSNSHGAFPRSASMQAPSNSGGRARTQQALPLSSTFDHLHMVPVIDRDVTTDSRAPSKAYVASIRDIAMQTAPLRQKMSNDRLSNASGRTGSSNGTVSTVSPLIAGAPTFPVSPLTPGFSNGSFGMHFNVSNSSSSSGGGVGSSRSLRRAPKHSNGSRLQVSNEAKRLSVVNESRQSWLELEDHDLKVPAESNGGWKKACEEINAKYKELFEDIYSQVRRVVVDEMEAANISRMMMSNNFDVLDTFLEEGGIKVVREKVEEIRESIWFMACSGVWESTAEEINHKLDKAKQRKAVALLEKWQAEAKAEEETKSKGKGKEVVDHVAYRDFAYKGK